MDDFVADTDSRLRGPRQRARGFETRLVWECEDDGLGKRGEPGVADGRDCLRWVGLQADKADVALKDPQTNYGANFFR